MADGQRRTGSKGPRRKAICQEAICWESECSAAADEEDSALGLAHMLSFPPDMRPEAQLLDKLRWWLKHLAASGAELAAELQLPEHVLLEVLRRGQCGLCPLGTCLQDEGDDVRHYTIILAGRCKLKCSKPAPTRPRATFCTGSEVVGGCDPTDEELVASGALDRDGMVPLAEVKPGESLGMYPGTDKSACYEVTCLERTTVLQLGREDYEAVLKPFHRHLHGQALDFLQSHRLCPEATLKNLEWLARFLRPRRVLKGRTIMRAGDPHRNLWFLREGACSVHLDAEAAADVVEQASRAAIEEGREPEVCSEDEETEDPARLAQMRSVSRGAKLQNRAAAEEIRNKTIAKYARGSMRNFLEGSCRSAADLASGASSKQGRSPAAILSEPGVMLGEEVLMFDPRDLVAAKCSYTVKAEQECSFYVADITTWRQIAHFVGTEGIAQVVQEQLQRRCKMMARTKVVSKRLDRRKRSMVKSELTKEDRRQVHLPSSTGGHAPRELEDVEDLLQLVFDHRRGPRNEKNLPTLSALEGTKLGPGCPSNGPAVNKLLKVVSQNPSGELSAKKYCDNLRRLSMGPSRRVKTAPSWNPMGETLSVEASTYYESEPHELLLKRSSTAPLGALTMGDVSRVSSTPSGISQQASGIFFHTELDTAEVTLMQSSSVPLLPRVAGPGLAGCAAPDSAGVGGGVEAEDSLLRSESPMFEASRSQPSAPRPLTSGSGRARDGLLAGSAGLSELLGSQRKPPRSAAAERQTKLMKAFARAVAKKSVLVLTEKADVRKMINRSLIAAGVDLCFVKSSTATWQKLQAPKESFHALIWDLTKTEVSVDELLKNIRAHDRYSRLPVIVLSKQGELAETVRMACSFVVFHPVVPSMVREAFLWCFDRRTLTGMASKQETLTSSAFDEFVLAPGNSLDAWPAEALAPPQHRAAARGREALSDAALVDA